jgi:YidC/Oxa1 family membrane protein insertase
MQQKNWLLFFVLTLLLIVGWGSLSNYLWSPQRKPANKPVVTKNETEQAKNAEVKKAGDKSKADDKKAGDKVKADDKKAAEDKKSARKKEDTSVADLQQLPQTPENKLIPLGSPERDSRFHLFAQIDPRGAGVRGLWCNKYQAADDMGRPEWANAEKTEPKLLELISAKANAQSPSFLTFAFDVNAPKDNQPLDTLARLNWTVVERDSDEVDGRRRAWVALRAETQGVVVTKTYSLTEGDYHLGLSVKMRRKDGGDKAIKFRYQMTGAHGLPVEGKWYTNIFRNALIAWIDKKTGTVTRDLQDLRDISRWSGGNLLPRQGDNALLYAGIVNPYFASVIVVDNKQTGRDFLDRVRPTLETTLTRGEIVSVAEDRSSFVLKTDKGTEQTFYLPKHARVKFREGSRYAVRHHTASCSERNGEYPEIATKVEPEPIAPPGLWVDDITVRVTTEEIELKGEHEVEHKYLLYQGPVKVSQLFPPPGLSPKPLEQGGVPLELLARYHDELHLNTLTDYHSPGFMGRFANFIYFTDLVVKCTNVMHAILGYLHAVISNYGLCIIVLTILVRGLMFPLSRKQALMSVRMQELQPEMKKIQEKYKDDPQARSLAMWEFQRKNGINPLGSCWVLLLQMPIFMGLYFALQESTHFRLAEFWPTWITNLAAPDMVWSWGERVPFISRVQDYGSFHYLGPYFNLLPVIAVALMIVQQKMITPPPTDEQQAMQQKLMKYMMIVIGLMFYKVAAGLCLYFIASSAWGFCERKLLPKKKTEAAADTSPPSGESYFGKLLRQARGEQVTTGPATGVSTNGGVGASSESKGGAGGKRRRDKRRQAAAREAEAAANQASVLRRWRKRLRDWWVAVLEEARKKNRG